MKTALTFIIGLALALPSAASAASFSVTPATGSYVAVGDTLVLRVAVNPADSTVYTAMLDARFSPDMFEVVSFSMNDALLPLKMTGYDTVDNAAGVLVKTGGYTGGTSSIASFGTLVLRAKKSGTGSLTVSAASKLLDATDANQMSGAQTASFTITPAESSVVAPHETGEAEGTEYKQPQVKSENKNENISTADTGAATTTTSTGMRMLASVAEFVVSNAILFAALGLLVIAIVANLFVARRK